MKLTRETLRQIIKEEMSRLNEKYDIFVGKHVTGHTVADKSQDDPDTRDYKKLAFVYNDGRVQWYDKDAKKDREVKKTVDRLVKQSKNESKSTRLTDIMQEDIEFRHLAKSDNFDIITPEGRFEIEVKGGKPEYIISGGNRIKVDRNPVYKKYEKEIKDFLKESTLTEDLAMIRKIVRRAKKLGIDNWDDLEDLIRDEFPKATGADFTFARQELGI